MFSFLKFRQSVKYLLKKFFLKAFEEFLNFKGKFMVEHWRDGMMIGLYPVFNGITNQGKMKVLDVMFNSSTAIASTSWYIFLIDNGGGSPSLANGDTMGSHSGWTEFSSYSGNRKLWGQGSASGNAVTNASPVTFDISGSGTLYGIGIVSVATGGTGSDILWSTAAFNATVPVTNGDQMKVTYTLAT